MVLVEPVPADPVRTAAVPAYPAVPDQMVAFQAGPVVAVPAGPLEVQAALPVVRPAEAYPVVPVRMVAVPAFQAVPLEAVPEDPVQTEAVPAFPVVAHPAVQAGPVGTVPSAPVHKASDRMADHMAVRMASGLPNSAHGFSSAPYD